MEQQKEKTGPKGPINKVKQVILIEGHPDSVFYDKEVEVCSIKLSAVSCALCDPAGARRWMCDRWG